MRSNMKIMQCGFSFLDVFQYWTIIQYNVCSRYELLYFVENLRRFNMHIWDQLLELYHKLQ